MMHRRRDRGDQRRLIDKSPIKPLAANDEIHLVTEIVIAATRPQMCGDTKNSQHPARIAARDGNSAPG